MGTVVRIATAGRHAAATEPLAALARAVSMGRHGADDVFWLKENAEFLGALVATRTPLPDAALALYAPIYNGLAARLQFFPQYYRFYLSLALDLETLGMPGDVATRLCGWVAAQGLADAELSDLQRAEARFLLDQRGQCGADDAGLQQRLRAFAARSDLFALPNRKAAYELTHILFYLSRHGRCDPQVSPAVIVSLHHAGLIAWLEQNCDLLAEICIALRYAGGVAPPLWVDWLATMLRRSRVQASPRADDAYHAWLMTHWALAASSGTALTLPGLPQSGVVSFQMPVGAAVLHDLSRELLRLGPLRRADWTQMRAVLCRSLDAEQQAVLTLAETAPVDFDRFFALFARAGAGPG